ncbi:S24 family peptidase [Rosenbergiella collisarenosi]|uniref:S24 family peptidase n=1 Tax=Rosenbergiella collisarenosi TaxID=1544695 RepID=UPI001F4DEF86|nr:S24 family peptidase [Rosenbergiella collisarenosi]
MGFPSPAKDFEEQSLSLDQLCNTRAPSVYLMRYAQGSQREYIKPNSVLVIDSALAPTSGSLVVVTIDGEFSVRRYVLASGVVRLELLDEPAKGRISSDDALFEGDWPQFFGVVTNTLTYH